VDRALLHRWSCRFCHCQTHFLLLTSPVRSAILLCCTVCFACFAAAAWARILWARATWHQEGRRGGSSKDGVLAQRQGRKFKTKMGCREGGGGGAGGSKQDSSTCAWRTGCWAGMVCAGVWVRGVLAMGLRWPAMNLLHEVGGWFAVLGFGASDGAVLTTFTAQHNCHCGTHA
jgi:hypothetical protein